MDKQEIKIYLKNHPEKIQLILEQLNCYHIKNINNKRIQAALPYPSDNITSISIKLNNSLSTEVYSKNEFDKYEVKDIFTLVQYIKNISFKEARNFIYNICGFKYTINKNIISQSYNFIKSYKRSLIKDIDSVDTDNILNENFCTRFIREDCYIYLKDGVNSKTQEKFGVSYDVLENRIVFPIRDDYGNLLSFKGRTCEENYKDKDIPKFISYYPCYNNNYLFGLYENYNFIMQSEELVVVEAEKGTMQLDSMGINNVVATNKKNISAIQVKKILKLGKTVILAFDKDVTLDEILLECSKFNGLTDVYYIYDTLNLLQKKESPCDKGIKIFNQLYNECKFLYKGVK